MAFLNTRCVLISAATGSYSIYANGFFLSQGVNWNSSDGIFKPYYMNLNNGEYLFSTSSSMWCVADKAGFEDKDHKYYAYFNYHKWKILNKKRDWEEQPIKVSSMVKKILPINFERTSPKVIYIWAFAFIYFKDFPSTVKLGIWICPLRPERLLRRRDSALSRPNECEARFRWKYQGWGGGGFQWVDNKAL